MAPEALPERVCFGERILGRLPSPPARLGPKVRSCTRPGVTTRPRSPPCRRSGRVRNTRSSGNAAPFPCHQPNGARRGRGAEPDAGDLPPGLSATRHIPPRIEIHHLALRHRHQSGPGLPAQVTQALDAGRGRCGADAAGVLGRHVYRVGRGMEPAPAGRALRAPRPGAQGHRPASRRLQDGHHPARHRGDQDRGGGPDARHLERSGACTTP